MGLGLGTAATASSPPPPPAAPSFSRLKVKDTLDGRNHRRRLTHARAHPLQSPSRPPPHIHSHSPPMLSSSQRELHPHRRRLSGSAFVLVCVRSGAATRKKGFVICFLKVPLACLGSMAAAVQPDSLRKTFYKTFFMSCRPRL